MAIFAVEQRNISEVWEHPNADRLDLAKVEGIDLQFVIGKDSYDVGDMVVYFPISSILPDSLIEHLGFGGRLAGKRQNRVKTMKLRGEISQGFVTGVDNIFQYVKDNDIEIIYGDDNFVDYTATLGVVKYDPPEIACNDGILHPLPEGVSMFDIEGVERFQDVAEILMNVPCVISEKIEGTNWGLTITPDDEIFVNQRNNSIEELPNVENVYWKVARNGGFIDLIKDIKKENNASQVTIRGELIGEGVQGNYYGIKGHKVLIFAVQIDYRYQGIDTIIKYFDINQRVPIIGFDITLREWLEGKSIAEASTGKSVLNPNKLREGIVIAPMVEQRHPAVGRVILKKHSPDYLTKR